MYFTVSFIAPVAVTFLTGIVVVGFNSFLYGRRGEPIFKEDSQDATAGRLARIANFCLKLPFLFLLLLLGVLAGVAYNMGEIVLFLRRFGEAAVRFILLALLLSVHELGYEVVAMAKKTEKIHYLHEGVMQDVKAIYRKRRKRRGRPKYLLSVEAAVRKGSESLPIRLVFVRNRNNRKDWLVLVTTNMSLTEEEMIRIYGKR